MKKTIYFILIACACLFSVQCAKVHESELSPEAKASGNYMEIRGSEVFMSISVNEASKTTIGTDRSVSWNKGDKLYVVAPTGGCLGYLEAENAGKSVNFIGSIGTWSGTQNLQFYYLGSGSLASGATTYPYDITAQSGTLESLASNLQLMHGQITGLAAGTKTLGALSMSSIIAVARFDLLTSSGFTTSYTVKCTAPATATLNLADGTFSGQTSGDITLSNPADDYYMAVIPGTKTMSFWQSGIGTLFNPSSEILANQMCTSGGDAIQVASVGGYTEDGFSYGSGIEINGVTWAPVNCGVGFNTEFAYGKIYQYGRKYGQGYNDGVTYTTETAPTVSDVFTGNNGDDAPNTFYKLNSKCNWINNSSDEFWNASGSKGAFDPCPDGWRIPTLSEFESLVGGKAVTLSSYQTGTQGTYSGLKGLYFNGTATAESGVFIPAGGNISGNNASAQHRGSQACYWVTTVKRPNENDFAYSYGAVGIVSQGRALGQSVRCVKETTVPEGYTKLKYLQSTADGDGCFSGQYIDTEFYHNQNTGFEVSFIPSFVSGWGWSNLFGSRTSDHNKELVINWNEYESGFSYYNTGRLEHVASQNLQYNCELTFGSLNTLSYINNVFTSAKSTRSTLTVDNYTATVPLYIFALNSNGSATEFSSVKLHYLQLYNGSTLVRHYIPVRRSDGVLGLYELIEKKFYTNKGTGSFTGIDY